MLYGGSGQWGQGRQRAQEPQTWPVSLQEGVEGPRPALHNPQKPAGPDQGGETRLSSGGPCAKGCGFLTKGEGVAVPRWAGARWIWPQLDCPLQSHPSAWPFMEPVKKSEAPDYYEVIRFPIGEDPSFQLLPPTPAPAPAPHGQAASQRHALLSCYPDLKTMTERLRSRYYVTRKLFVADLQRVIANCREYNPPDSEYCRCASALEKFFYFKLKEGGLIDK